MTRILLVYYSQSGEAAHVAEALAGPLRCGGVELVVERLRPVLPYPYPWRSIATFFDILPECHVGPPRALEPVGIDGQRFDLVILVYPVWFLAPAPPVQSFLRSEAGAVLRHTRVVTVSVSRNMWQSASEAMKALLRQLGARHIDNVVLTHQGPAWATFVSTPRALLYGKKEGLWGVFPRAGLGAAELERVGRLARAILDQHEKLGRPEDQSLLRGLGAVRVERRYLLAELLGWYWFRAWARGLHRLGRLGPGVRRAGVYLFVVALVLAIVVGIPVTMGVRLLLSPVINRWIAAYALKLAEPSGE